MKIKYVGIESYQEFPLTKTFALWQPGQTSDVTGGRLELLLATGQFIDDEVSPGEGVLTYTKTLTGVIEISDTLAISQGVGGLLTITGTTDPVLYPILDFGDLDLRAGDVVETEAIWTYTSSANSKALALVYGPNEASVASIAASTRSVSGEVLFVFRTKLWFESETQFLAHSSIMVPWANQNQALAVKTCNATDKLYLRGTLGLATETLQLRAQSTIVTRAAR